MAIASFPGLLLGSGILVWLGVIVTTAAQARLSPALGAWAAASLAFAGAFLRSARLHRAAPAELVIQGISIIIMVALLCNGFEGLLLVLIAAQLGYWSRTRRSAGWIVVESALLFIAISWHWNIRAALLLTPPYLGFGGLMFVTTRLLREEAETRSYLASALEELRRAQAALAAQARLDERLRIAQGLHDSLGHQLTALSINLEVASHAQGARASNALLTAQNLARLCLGEIRSLAQEVRQERPIDLEHELGQLARDLPRPRLHVTCASPLKEIRGEVGRVLLQSVQEVTTNAIRHGSASNVWIEIAQRKDLVEMLARDDGHGAGDIHIGFGLAGIRRRVEALGGSVALGSHAGGGFQVTLHIPHKESMAGP
jgi:signal transduction histidine kinase